MKDEIKIINISQGEKAIELEERMVELLNEYSGILTGFEMIGVIDAVKVSAHDSIKFLDEEE